MQTEKLYGPPGTGKTTTLVRMLKEALRRYRPHEIAYVSFTRKGTYEGVARALEQFKLTKEDCPFFRTIHSLCFRELSLCRGDVFAAKHYQKFSAQTGMRFYGRTDEDVLKTDDKYLFIIQLAQNNPAMFKRVVQEANPATLQYVARAYNEYKRNEQVIDFTDMLAIYLKKGSPLPVRVAFIDEAQDLTPLQWQVADKMFSLCEKVVYAGDDDQSIFEWAGADTGEFLRRGAQVKTLTQSYRIPEAVHQTAMRVISRVHSRAEKDYAPAKHKGSVAFFVDIADVLPRNRRQDTLVLARNKIHLQQIARKLKERGELFLYKGNPSTDENIFKAIFAFNRAQQENSEDAIKALSLYKKYYKNYGNIKFLLNMHWTDVINLDRQDVLYYYILIEKGKVKYSAPTSLNLSTIHAAKGSEADTVILCTELTRETRRAISYNPDAEMRCLYVGVTRARKKLLLQISKADEGYPLKLLTGKNA